MPKLLNSRISIYCIPTPASDKDITEYSKIRLSALLTNPEAFSSTYENALSIDHEEWRERVNTPGRTTIIAHRLDKNEDAEDKSDAECIGTLSVLHPEMLVSASDPLPVIDRISDAVESDTIERHLLVGMWVHPSARKMGVGKKLIHAALDVIKRHQLNSADTSPENTTKTKIVFLEVHIVNYTAKALYSLMGFEEETECSGVEEGHACMTITL